MAGPLWAAIPIRAGTVVSFRRSSAVLLAPPNSLARPAMCRASYDADVPSSALCTLGPSHLHTAMALLTRIVGEATATPDRSVATRPSVRSADLATSSD